MSYYTRLGDHRYAPTEFASGAWQPNELHFSPLGGLIVHEIDRHREGRGLVLARVSFDILGFLGMGECEIRVETVRPGRTIELVEAVAAVDGRDVVRARAWFLAEYDTTSVEGGAPERFAAPDTLPRTDLSERWPGGFVASLDARVIAAEPGRATVWIRSEHPILDEPVGESATFVSLVDAANGVAIRVPPTAWVYPNVDLTIHFHRQPSAGWVGLDTSVTFGPAGQGVTASTLHDVDGPVGFAHQMLTVRPLPG